MLPPRGPCGHLLLRAVGRTGLGLSRMEHTPLHKLDSHLSRSSAASALTAGIETLAPGPGALSTYNGAHRSVACTPSPWGPVLPSPPTFATMPPRRLEWRGMGIPLFSSEGGALQTACSVPFPLPKFTSPPRSRSSEPFAGGSRGSFRAREMPKPARERLGERSRRRPGSFPLGLKPVTHPFIIRTRINPPRGKKKIAL